MKRSTILSIAGLGLAAWGTSRLLGEEFSFAGKCVVITGGSRGLGLTMARLLAREGARLALLARDEDELRQACGELEKLGAACLPVRCDLLDREQSLGAIRRVREHFGPIDVLINNAGIIEIGPLEHMQREDFEKAMQLHFWAPFNLIQQIAPQMRERGAGRIVNISSIGGKIAVPHMAPYSASKFALVGLSDAVRAELARDGVFVTTVTPSVMRTGSEVHAQFKGDHGAEYTWFALSAALPLTAVKAERAARMIVEACRRGQGSLTIGFSARLAIAGNAVFPGLTSAAMKLVNRLLPAPVGRAGDELQSGREAQRNQKLPRSLSWLLENPARARHNEE